jgi:signal transduction histidine kinase
MEGKGQVFYDRAGKPTHMRGVCTDVTERKQAEDELRKERENLEARIIERTSKLNAANGSLRELSGRLMQIRDDESRRLARELHDSIGQLLAALSMNNSVVGAEVNKLSPAAARAFSENVSLVNQISAEIRTISHLLHPPLLDEAGLPSAPAMVCGRVFRTQQDQGRSGDAPRTGALAERSRNFDLPHGAGMPY